MFSQFGNSLADIYFLKFKRLGRRKSRENAGSSWSSRLMWMNERHMIEADGPRNVAKQRDILVLRSNQTDLVSARTNPSRHISWQQALNHWHRETWCTSIKCDCTQEFVCVRGSVFSISAQRPVLWRQTLPPQPLNKPAQQKQELVFRIGPKLSCGQIAYLIKVVMEISKKTLWPHSYELHFCSCIVPSGVSFLLALHGFSSFSWLYCRFD